MANMYRAWGNMHYSIDRASAQSHPYAMTDVPTLAQDVPVMTVVEPDVIVTSVVTVLASSPSFHWTPAATVDVASTMEFPTNSPPPPAHSTSAAPVVVASSASTSTTSSPSMPSPAASGFEGDVLNSTNYYREKYGARPLSWNTTLADFASSYADTCEWSHSGGPYGENLAMGYGSVALAIDGWGDEESEYNWSQQGFSNTTGHFTQLVWKDTTTIGCALVPCKNTASGGVDGSFLVCEFSPRGNMDGEYVQNVRKRGIDSRGQLGLGGSAAGSGAEARRAVVTLLGAYLLMSVLMLA